MSKEQQQADLIAELRWAWMRLLQAEQGILVHEHDDVKLALAKTARGDAYSDITTMLTDRARAISES